MRHEACSGTSLLVTRVIVECGRNERAACWPTLHLKMATLPRWAAASLALATSDIILRRHGFSLSLGFPPPLTRIGAADAPNH